MDHSGWFSEHALAHNNIYVHTDAGTNMSRSIFDAVETILADVWSTTGAVNVADMSTLLVPVAIREPVASNRLLNMASSMATRILDPVADAQWAQHRLVCVLVRTAHTLGTVVKGGGFERGNLKHIAERWLHGAQLQAFSTTHAQLSRVVHALDQPPTASASASASVSASSSYPLLRADIVEQLDSTRQRWDHPALSISPQYAETQTTRVAPLVAQLGATLSKRTADLQNIAAETTRASDSPLFQARLGRTPDAPVALLLTYKSALRLLSMYNSTDLSVASSDAVVHTAGRIQEAHALATLFVSTLVGFPYVALASSADATSIIVTPMPPIVPLSPIPSLAIAIQLPFELDKGSPSPPSPSPLPPPTISRYGHELSYLYPTASLNIGSDADSRAFLSDFVGRQNTSPSMVAASNGVAASCSGRPIRNTFHLLFLSPRLLLLTLAQLHHKSTTASLWRDAIHVVLPLIEHSVYAVMWRFQQAVLESNGVAILWFRELKAAYRLLLNELATNHSELKNHLVDGFQRWIM